MGLERINKNLLDLLVLFTREPAAKFMMEEVEGCIDSERHHLGMIALDRTDKDYHVQILMRNEHGQYVTEWNRSSITTIEEARSILNEGSQSLDEGLTPPAERDPIAIEESVEDIHPYFKLLAEDVSYAPAREVLREVFYHYTDKDGNFLQQLQSLNGMDARLWELYLFCACREMGFSFLKISNRPDFMLEKFDEQVALEAVIVGRDETSPPSYLTQDVLKSLENVQEKLQNEMPLRFGSPLFSKLTKEYWELPHVKDIPFVIAIADFHDNASMTWSFPAITDCLYGTRHTFRFDDKGNMEVEGKPIGYFTKESGVKIPAGIFMQAGNEHLSAVMFSATGTLSKFNRIGKQAGLSSPNLSILRFGARFKHDKDSYIPEGFSRWVDEECQETWAEGLHMFHNPNAAIPLNDGLFPGIAHHHFTDGMIISRVPEFSPFFSINVVVIAS